MAGSVAKNEWSTECEATSQLSWPPLCVARRQSPWLLDLSNLAVCGLLLDGRPVLRSARSVETAAIRSFDRLIHRLLPSLSAYRGRTEEPLHSAGRDPIALPNSYPWLRAHSSDNPLAMVLWPWSFGHGEKHSQLTTRRRVHLETTSRCLAWIGTVLVDEWQEKGWY